jgi:hypothetical protein
MLFALAESGDLALERNVAGQTSTLYAPDRETDLLVAPGFLEVRPLRLQNQETWVVRRHKEHGTGFGFQQSVKAPRDDSICRSPVMAQDALEDLVAGIKQFQQLCVRNWLGHGSS